MVIYTLKLLVIVNYISLNRNSTVMSVQSITMVKYSSQEFFCFFKTVYRNERSDSRR